MAHTISSRRLIATLALASGLALAACGSDDGDGAASVDTGTATTSAPGATDAPAATEAPVTTVAPTTTAPAEPLRIMVTNDDGVGAAGIDVLVEALRTLPDVEVTVIAPDTNKSGSGESTTPGNLTAVDASTASGYPAIAVSGFPADTVIYALEQGGLVQPPHLVVSGINEGQNIGPLVDVSGTVGAAKAAVRRGVPALASSQGLLPDGPEPDYESGAELVLEWVQEHREALLAGTAALEVTNLNIPTCPVGEVRETTGEPVATDLADRDLFAVDCTSTLADPVDDVDGFINGFAVYSVIVPA